MRLLHTADWHIGRVTMGIARDEDIHASIEEVIQIARDERPDLIVHAGDVFDSFRPAWADLHWATDKLRELAELAQSGQLRPHIEEVFPLERAAAAHERLEGGHVRGKLVLSVPA